MYLGLKVPATLLTVSYATSKVVCFRKSYSNGVTKLLQKSLSSRRSCRGLDFWQTQCKNPQTRARVVQRSSFRFFNNHCDFRRRILHDTKNVVFELSYHPSNYFDCGAGKLQSPATFRFIRTRSPATTSTTNHVRTNDGAAGQSDDAREGRTGTTVIF